MPRLFASLTCCTAILIGVATMSFAQSRTATLVTQQASVRNGTIAGVVHDDAGQVITGASIVALGALPLPVMVRSDGTGRFLMALPPGQYILRATGQGYVSTYREPVRIQSSVQLERTITLLRAAAAEPVVLLSSFAPVIDGRVQISPASSDAGDEKGDHSHNETAWRLRHLTPTALRDIAAPALPSAVMADSFKRRSSVGSLLGNSDLKGQVNFLTSSTVAARDVLLPSSAPRGIAYVAVSAPVGDFGEWSVRGATSAGSASSWVLLGEYRARRGQAHEFNIGVSYSSQLSANGSGAGVAAISDQVRSAGGIYAFDLWRVWRVLDLDYGLRVDRYDYVAGSTFLSPRVGMRLAVLPHTRLLAGASERAIAPGSEEFLPPPSSGPWLPPERTFTPLRPGAVFEVERLRNYDVGLEQQFGDAGAPVLQMRLFRQQATHQTATLFGVGAESDIGHYYVATPGGVAIDGTALRIAGRIARHVHGSVDYIIADAQWTTGADAAAIAAVTPLVLQPGRDRLHDLTASIETTIPDTDTRVVFVYRTSSVFAGPRAAALPLLDGRFNLELHQALPFEPIRGSKVELLLAVRNLFRDPGEAGSIYDELLTVSPPMRILGGVQVKF